MPSRAVEIRVTGVVQGVGFRYHVYRLAVRYGLQGWVCNTPDGAVLMQVEGDPTFIERFTEALRSRPPSLARIEQLASVEKEPAGYKDFEIRTCPD